MMNINAQRRPTLAPDRDLLESKVGKGSGTAVDIHTTTTKKYLSARLERVAEELMGRRKWKLYQEGMLPREDAPPADAPDPPALKIKTIEQINARDHDHDRDRARDQGQEQERSRPETILESLIKRPPAPPKLDTEEPADWKPPDKCYFCVDGEKGETIAGPTSPQSESDSSSVSGARSPAAAPPLLQHLLQLQTQSPHAIAQFQQVMATLAALGGGLVPPPALSHAWLMQRLLHAQQPATAAAAHHRLVGETSEKTDGSSALEQPLDLSAKPAPSASPPPAAPITSAALAHDPKLADNTRLKRSILESTGVGVSGAAASAGASAAASVGGGFGAARRAYSDDELASALRDIQTGRLGTRRAALLYGIPRSTLRNKVYKLAAEPGHESEGDSDPERDSPPSVILKIPTFPPPDDKPASPAPPTAHPAHPTHPAPPRHAAHPAHSTHPAPLLLPPSVFADPPAPQHLFTSLSDVIAKSISQKFQQPLDRVQPELPFLRAPDRHVSVIKTPPDAARAYATVGPAQPPGAAAAGGPRAAPNNGQTAAAAGGKGTRPKRGKYRNYDRDSLVEAVKAVQRGEMSVHRAGSYYGVPHSTLEYKVKERHLMRPRKREPKPPLEPKPAPKPQPPKPIAKPFPNGLGANGPDPTVPYAAYSFWASGFAPPTPSAPDLYASHMMRRLRDEAPPPHTPPALPAHPPPSANGSFLEGIIRSSLERPGVAGASASAGAGGVAGAALLQRLNAVTAEEPAARRPRLDTTDRQLAADMRDTVQRLRQDKLRPRNGTPTPPAPSTPAPSAPSPEVPPSPSPISAPPDRV